MITATLKNQYEINYISTADKRKPRRIEVQLALAPKTWKDVGKVYLRYRP